MGQIGIMRPKTASGIMYIFSFFTVLQLVTRAKLMMFTPNHQNKLIFWIMGQIGITTPELYTFSDVINR